MFQRGGGIGRILLIAVAVLGMTLTAPSLRSGLVADDLLHQHHIQQVLKGGSQARWWDLFQFVQDDPAMLDARRSRGLLPWWTTTNLQIAFWRPLSAATHFLDHLLWPKKPWAMHAQSILWFGLLCWLVGRFYGRTMGVGAGAAVLAALLFAVDDVHGNTVGWVANRNALIAGVFCMLTLLAHRRWRLDGWRPGAALAPGFLLLSLLSAEAGITTFALLLAFALTLDPGRAGSRVRSLLPAMAVVLLWFAAYRWLGYGVHGSGLYLHPVEDPMAYLQQLPTRAGQIMAILLSIPYALAMGPWAGAILLLCLASTLLGVLLLVGHALINLRRDPQVRFWLLATLLSLPPTACAPVHPRVLLLASIPFAGWLARLMTDLFRARRWRVTSRLALTVLAITHLVLAPLVLVLSAGNSRGLAENIARMGPDPLAAVPNLSRKQLIIVNAPDYYSGQLLSMARVVAGRQAPALSYFWCSTHQWLEVHRLDEWTLELYSPDWFGRDPLPANFRSPTAPLRPGQVIQLKTHKVQVMETRPNGRPRRVRFEFAFSLENDTFMHMLSWDGRRYRTFKPPAVGQHVRIQVGRRDGT